MVLSLCIGIWSFENAVYLQKILPQGEVTVPTKNGRNLFPEFGLVHPLRYKRIDLNWAMPSECGVLQVFQCQFFGICEKLSIAKFLLG